jgi:hypothetical protein
MSKITTISEILKIGKKYVPAIDRDNNEKILDTESVPLEVFHTFSSNTYQDEKLVSLEAVLPLDKLNDEFQGRIDKYTSVSHHIWVTNMEKPRDIVTYISDVFKYNQYNPNKVTGNIDDPDNTFIGSILNLRKCNIPLSDSDFHHILWINYSREDLEKHPELTNLRKICKIDNSSIQLPNFIVLNICDVMEKDIGEIKNQADLSKDLPHSIIDGLVQMKKDLNSILDALNDFKSDKKFVNISDVIRIAAVKDIGGIYFDLDYNLFHQERLHKNNQYNLFDLMKHYDSIVGKESSKRLCNAFISAAKAGSKVVTSIWDTVKKNITSPDEVDYVRYSKNTFDKVICQTGPVTTTVGFLKDQGEYDIALDFGVLYYNNFKRPPHQVKLEGKIGPIGYDTWGGTWLESKYNEYTTYLYYDAETGRGITEAEWKSMF